MRGDRDELIALICPLIGICLLDRVKDIAVLVVRELELHISGEAVRNGDLVLIAFVENCSEIAGGKVDRDLVVCILLSSVNRVLDPGSTALALQDRIEVGRDSVELSRCAVCIALGDIRVLHGILKGCLVGVICSSRIVAREADCLDSVDDGLGLSLQRVKAASVLLDVACELRSVLSRCLVCDEVNSSVELFGDIVCEGIIAVIVLLAVGEGDIVGCGLVELAVIDLNKACAEERELVPVDDDRIAVCIHELDAASGQGILCDCTDALIDAVDADLGGSLVHSDLHIQDADAVCELRCFSLGEVSGVCKVSDHKISDLLTDKRLLNKVLVADDRVDRGVELVIPDGFAPLDGFCRALLAFNHDRELINGRKREEFGVNGDIGNPSLVEDGAGSAVSCVDVDACRGKLAHEEHGTGCGCEHTLKN